MTVEQELIEIFASTPGERNRDILVGYYGWEDGRQHTLTEIGTRFGITRSECGRCSHKLTKRIQTPAAVPAPALDQALALIAARLPCPAAQIEAEMVAQRLTAVGMSTEGVAAAAKLLARPVRFKTIRVPGGTDDQPGDSRLVIRPDQLDAVLAIVDRARRRSTFTAWQASHEIESAMAAQERPAGESGAGAANPATYGWLLLARRGHRLVPLLSIHKHGLPKAVDKVLAVAGSVTVSQLRRGSSNRRLWKEPPPENVLLEFCRQCPESGLRAITSFTIRRGLEEGIDRRGSEARLRAAGPRPGDGPTAP